MSDAAAELVREPAPVEPAPPAEFDPDELERALREARADAVWVGWGFVAEQAVQCGYCSSGMLIGAAALLMVLTFLHLPRFGERKAPRIDWWGATAVVATLVPLLPLAVDAVTGIVAGVERLVLRSRGGV